MRRAAEPIRSPRWIHLTLFAAISVAGAGCSADTQRFDANPYRGSPEVTGSVAPRTSAVQSAPLPAPNTAARHAPSTRPAATGTAGGSKGMASYQPGSAGGGDVTGTVSPATTGGTSARRGRGHAPHRQAAAPTGDLVHVIAPGETLMKLSRQYHKSLTEIARANNIPPNTLVKIGDRFVIPGVRAPRTTAVAKPARPVPVAQKSQKPKPAPAPKMASAPATTTARVLTPAAHRPEPDTRNHVVTASTPSFRWPVRGRVISGFGPRPSGQQNDGINVAVPEGTPIKAASDGVVAYAGNELKSYGNLVLVRHPNGYVTAYSHAGEILVKRDDPVKRGQVIARSGQTGNVAAPQLHFEIRKGSTPVDPLPFLDKGGTT
jgi:murein DD-endopeptidase MepM/ murein hydrolase activator NlpD